MFSPGRAVPVCLPAQNTGGSRKRKTAIEQGLRTSLQSDSSSMSFEPLSAWNQPTAPHYNPAKPTLKCRRRAPEKWYRRAGLPASRHFDIAFTTSDAMKDQNDACLAVQDWDNCATTNKRQMEKSQPDLPSINRPNATS